MRTLLLLLVAAVVVVGLVALTGCPPKDDGGAGEPIVTKPVNAGKAPGGPAKVEEKTGPAETEDAAKTEEPAGDEAKTG
ncbi:MAG TPA: hypothetical protein PLQ54_13065, partial [Armatimonadota bacterium]|nr:hypothetical protein [Armatimonadota bacterium]